MNSERLPRVQGVDIVDVLAVADIGVDRPSPATLNFIADIILVIVFLQHFHGTEAVRDRDQFRRRAKRARPWRRQQAAPVWALIRLELNRLPALPDEMTVPVGVQTRARRAWKRAEAVGGVERAGTRAGWRQAVRPCWNRVVAVRDWSHVQGWLEPAVAMIWFGRRSFSNDLPNLWPMVPKA